MNRPNEEPSANLQASAQAGELVAVIGTGVSISLTEGKYRYASWIGLLEDGLQYATDRGLVNEIQFNTWHSLLKSTDVIDLISVAEFVTRKLGGLQGDLYARWLQERFQLLRPEKNAMFNAISALHASNVRICTLNYDHLIEHVTGLSPISINDIHKSTAWMRREIDGILHLHGSWNEPHECVLGMQSYDDAIRSETRDLIQRSLASFRRLLFIGCGDTFADPNFAALIKWLRGNLRASTLQHFAMVRTSEVPFRKADPTWHGFVDPFGYGPNFEDLPGAILNLFPTRTSLGPVTSNGRQKRVKEDPRAALIVDAYRRFLVKDCGQMTIEGVRADADTAQRKFDLERLFVPLQVNRCEPDIPKSDPEREEKLAKWIAENKSPTSFGDAFKKYKRIALLALPGGGKTLLMKRLAVAYAEPLRRNLSYDNLPKLDILPIVIKCREWRGFLQKPIAVMLSSMHEITGNTDLAELGDAIKPRLEAGRILLIVDGLDEIHSDAERQVFAENLEKFIEDFPKIRLLVTSREAGFSLIAPCLSRFCEKLKIAPLDREAIGLLVSYWHTLMAGATPESALDAKELTEALTTNQSLRRLAENPLLLTMLLVVKHGAGRLPPDRVTLYERAVEVLLDTWNIKGHEALQIREAVPQLACVAFELFRSGKQTATEQELVSILERARERIPQIRRYAKDDPYTFLKRVELRSSLVVEAGHQLERGKLVPFYQFRHLTFQEYLAAVAAAQGHYLDYSTDDDVSSPFKDDLTAPRWKEVIPMAAVLAKKQAEPLIALLVDHATRIANELSSTGRFEDFDEWVTHRSLPASVSRLAQCLIEEAEATPDTIAAAIEIVAMFARGCHSPTLDWAALARGPYGSELIGKAWSMFKLQSATGQSWMRNTVASLLAKRLPRDRATMSAFDTDLSEMLEHAGDDDIAFKLAEFCGMIVENYSFAGKMSRNLERAISRFVRHKCTPYADIAIWAWSLGRGRKALATLANQSVLDWIFDEWLERRDSFPLLDVAMLRFAGVPRGHWKPKLTRDNMDRIRNRLTLREPPEHLGSVAAAIVSFYAQDVVSDTELLGYFDFRRGRVWHRPELDFFQRELGGVERAPYGARLPLGGRRDSTRR